MTHKTIQPEGWLPAKGYANGILSKDGTLHIGGQIGWDANKRFVVRRNTDDLVCDRQTSVSRKPGRGGQSLP